MPRLLPTLLAVLGLVLPAGGRLADAPAPGPRAADAPPAPEAVELADLRERPDAWLGKRVAFSLHLFDSGGAWQPWLSRFDTARWRRVRGFSERQFPWERAAHDDPAPYLFARVGSPAEFRVTLGRPYDRFEVTGVVREVFLGEPWIELESLARVEPAIGEGTVLHASRALALAADRRPGLAVQQLDRALIAPLPDAAREELERLRAAVEAQR